MLTSREKFISIINNDMIASSDAIILLEGDGYNRIKTAAELYLQGVAPKIVFTGGAINYEYGSYPAKEIIPKLANSGVSESDIIIEDKSLHTKAQAEEIINLALSYGWKRLILVASPDHQYRAYLTFLGTLLRKYPQLVLINCPAQTPGWFVDVGWKSQYDRLDQEFERIEKYTAMGHLASYEEAIKYQQWKEQQLKKQN